ncbi:aspartic proteinase nepenthesin-1-like [Pyrus communis]|uniref:aspartic proteinase nepenthesin-1-like n=1 Tax=Pyrus communis TaxID=23211 RepID=UPI0035C0D429
MRFKVGTPRVDTFGIFDMAGDLIWFQCKPCEKCYEQGIPTFDPANSDSYQKVMCGSIECNTTSDAHCPDPKGERRYKIAYQVEVTPMSKQKQVITHLELWDIGVRREPSSLVGGEGGVFMDSATTHTMLAFGAFSELRSRFQADKTPEIVLHFMGLEFPVSADNTWAVNSQGHYCLAILPSFAGFTIFGMYQHRNVNVGYDFS